MRRAEADDGDRRSSCSCCPSGFLPFLGMEFIPTLDEGAIAINVVRLAERLPGRFGRDRAGDREAGHALPGGRDRGHQDRPGGDLRGSDGTGAERRLHHAEAARRTWKTGRDKQELVEAINGELSAIPGLRLSFSQPIALRVNELISGVKSDLAVKIFGPDLALLKEYADAAAAVLNDVPGARDVKVEQISGMTQETVEMDRAAMARYALNASEVNELLETGVAGRAVSTFIEGQQRFPISVRFEEEARTSVAGACRSSWSPRRAASGFRWLRSAGSCSETGRRR